MVTLPARVPLLSEMTAGDAATLANAKSYTDAVAEEKASQHAAQAIAAANAYTDAAVAAVPVFDDELGEYTHASLAAFMAAQRDGLAYGIAVPLGAATACVKTGANAGIPVPTPGVIGTPAVDAYAGRGPFFMMEVNGYVDSDGWPHVTAIDGDGNFSRTGSEDVWILAPTLWWRMSEDPDDVTITVCDSYRPGMRLQPKAKLPDGRLRPFMLYAKYPLSVVDGKPRSVSGPPPRTRDVSHNSLLTLCKTATTGYAGKSVADDWYLKIMFLLKYATKNSQSVFAGVTSHSQQVAPAAAETGVRRVLVTEAQGAQFPVGSAIMIGTNNPAGTSRGDAPRYDIVFSAPIISKGVVGGLVALDIDIPAPITMETSYLISTAPAHAGACDQVSGDGSPTNRTSGREPAVVQGIEWGHGVYEIVGDIILQNTGDGWRPRQIQDSQKAATSATADYADTGVEIETTDNAWKYPHRPKLAGDLLFGAEYGASTSTGMADGTYINPVTTIATRAWLGLGSLSDGSDAGLWCVVGNYGLGPVGWSIGSRLSGVGRAG